jgi:peptidoglycan-N-acetylglucosamine deacetylase
MIGKMMEKGDVWFAPMRDIAAHVRRCMADGLWTPRTETAIAATRGTSS